MGRRIRNLFNGAGTIISIMPERSTMMKELARKTERLLDAAIIHQETWQCDVLDPKRQAWYACDREIGDE